MKNNKFKYNIQSGVKKAFKSPVINISIVLSMILGLFFPIMLISFGMNKYEQARNSYPKNVERIYYVDPGLKEYQEEELEKKYDEIEMVFREQTSGKVVRINNKRSVVGVVECSRNFNKFFNRTVLKGRYFTVEEFQENEKVCILGEDYMNKVKIGNKIKIDDSEYLVVGYMDIDLIKNLIIVPSEKSIKPRRIRHVIKFEEGVTEKEMKKISKELTVENGIESVSATMIFEKAIKNAKLLLKILIGIGVIVFIYSAINILSVLVNKIKLEQKDNAVRMAHGARKKDILLDSFMQLNILTSIAIIVDSIIIFILSNFYNQININIIVVLAVTAVNIIWNLLVTTILINKNFDSSITENLLIR